MKRAFNLLCTIILFFFCASCRKDVGRIVVPEPPEVPLPALFDSISLPFNCEDTAANWKLQDQDPNFIPITKAGSLGVHRGIYDPNNPDIIYYVQTDSVGTDLHRTHNLYCYNRRTNKKIKLDSDLLGNVDINKNGWLVYDKMNWNIYKVRTNGDSLTQLTKNGRSQQPQWSEDGKFIYVYDTEDVNTVKYRIDHNGKVIDTLKFAAPYSSIICQKAEFIYYFKLNGSERLIFERNMITLSERIVLSNVNNQGQIVTNYFLDGKGDYLFWESNNGLYKTDLNSLTTVKVINSQRGSLNMVGAFWVSPISGRILAMQMNLIYFNYYYSEVNCYLLEYEPDGKCRRRLTLPD